MPSSRFVRFDASTKEPNEKHNKKRSREADGVEAQSFDKPKKFRPNQDELDDIDEYEADQDENDNDHVVPSERELLEAKRQRRQWMVKQVVGEESTHIDETTSLATDGIEIEPFHMRQEESDGTGYFEGDTYVFRKNPDGAEEPDAWLDSIEDENGKQPAHFVVPTKPNREAEEQRQSSMDNCTKEQLYAKILPLVSDTETVAQAVRRYGQLVKRKDKHTWGKQNKESADASSKGPSQETQDMAKSCLDELTGAANALLLKGEVDIYDTTRRDILSSMPQEKNDTQLREKPKEPVQWEYMGNQDGKIHGPYTTEQMVEWTRAGYFVGDQKVKIRSIRKKNLSDKEDLLADLIEDSDEPTPPENVVADEWMWSSEVDFLAYLPT